MDVGTWPFVKAFFDAHNIAHSQIASYDDFILACLPRIVRECGNVDVTKELQLSMEAPKTRRAAEEKFNVRFGQVFVDKPRVSSGIEDSLMQTPEVPLMPFEARARGLMYESRVYVDVYTTHYSRVVGSKSHAWVAERPEEHLGRLLIGCIPTMVRSRFCHLHGLTNTQLAAVKECTEELGGYFIANGAEKIIVAQERMAYNLPVCYEAPKQSVYAWFVDVRSKTHDSSSLPSLFRMMMYRGSCPNAPSKSSNQVHVQIQQLGRTIPVIVLMRAMGICTDRELAALTLGTDGGPDEVARLLCSSLEEASVLETEEAALDFIGKRAVAANGTPSFADRSNRISWARKLLCSEVLPHIGHTSADLPSKAAYVAFLLGHILNAQAGLAQPTNRDHYGYKRIDLVGSLMASQFKSLLNRSKVGMQRKLSRIVTHEGRVTLAAVRRTFDEKSVSLGMRHAIKTGSWGGKGCIVRQGVSQMLSRLNRVSSLSHMQRIDTSMPKESKSVPPRQLHGTHWGKVCCCESPEGEAVGLIKNLALSAVVSTAFPKLPERVAATLVPRLLGLESAQAMSDILKDMGDVAESEEEPVRLLRISKHATRGDRARLEWDDAYWIGPPEDSSARENLARSITWGSAREAVTDACARMNLAHPAKEAAAFARGYKICLDGEILGAARDGHEAFRIFEQLRSIKRAGFMRLPGDVVAVTSEMSVALDTNMRVVLVSTDEGRCMRPLFVLDNGTLPFDIANPGPVDWWTLLFGGSVELVDSLEEENLLIAMDPKDLATRKGLRFTHCELHPSLILGVSASTIPFPEHNQSPRNVYQSAMGKQALGIPSLNYQLRSDSVLHVLNYPQRPMTQSRTAELLRFDEMPAGVNAIVAVACYSGYNQEDSVILNQAAVDRGMFQSTTYLAFTKTEEFTEVRNGMYKCIKFERPDPEFVVGCDGLAKADLDRDGSPRLGRRIGDGSPILGMTSSVECRTRCASTTLPCTDGHLREFLHTLSIHADKPVDTSSKHSKTTKTEIGRVYVQSQPPRSPGEPGALIARVVIDEPCFAVYCDATVTCHAPTRSVYDDRPSTSRATRDFDCGARQFTLSGLPIQPDAGTLTFSLRMRICFEKKRDVSLYAKPHEQGCVDQVVSTASEQGQRMLTVKIRQVRIPEIGDKFASRHAQKGTCGLLMDACDMPFTADGLVPDVIINPHAFPSRMTIGQLVEAVASKVGTLQGTMPDSTPFDHKDLVPLIGQTLHRMGYQKWGNERMYNGHTGHRLDAMIFIAPTYYQRLKHMVADKIHARARGPVDTLTRQPIRGRTRSGGLRFGEMERDCLVAHGASAMLRDRLFSCSDPYRIHVCAECGSIAHADLDSQRFVCTAHRPNSKNVAQVFVPYTTKLLIQELMSMGISPRMKLTEGINV